MAAERKFSGVFDGEFVKGYPWNGAGIYRVLFEAL